MPVRLSQPRPDCLVVETGRAWRRFSLAGAAVVVSGMTLGLLDLATVGGLTLVGLAAVGLPVLAVSMVRAVRPSVLTLVRAQGRLLLEGEPLELARVELRVTHMPITRVPTGYGLSLWMMTSSGPIDVPLGGYRTLIEASTVSGVVEDFVQRASIRQPGHTGA
jgi:hypothetical protein